jgi:hypothetical protein
MHGVDGDFSLRAITQRERLAIEDFLSRQNAKLTLPLDSTAVVLPQSYGPNATMEELAVLVECAMGILCVSGFQPVTTVATLTPYRCTGALRRDTSKISNSRAFCAE